jgi:hypothetical protein
MMLETIYVAKPGNSGKGDNVNLTWRTPRHRPHGCTDFEKLLPAISNTIQIDEKLTASSGYKKNTEQTKQMALAN